MGLRIIALFGLLVITGCGEPQVDVQSPVITVSPTLMPTGVIKLTDAGCICPLLPPGVEYVLVPVIQLQGGVQ